MERKSIFTLAERDMLVRNDRTAFVSIQLYISTEATKRVLVDFMIDPLTARKLKSMANVFHIGCLCPVKDLKMAVLFTR